MQVTRFHLRHVACRWHGAMITNEGGGGGGATDSTAEPVWSAHMAHVCTLSLDIFTLDAGYGLECTPVPSVGQTAVQIQMASLEASLGSLALGVPSVMCDKCVQ